MPKNFLSSRAFWRFFGLTLGLGLLVYYAVTIDWALFLVSLKSLSPPSLGLTVTCLFGSTLIRAMRFESLIRPSVERGSVSFFGRLRESWLALCVGSLGNMLYPARAGEFIRMYEVHRRIGVTWGVSFTSVALDRVCDVFGIVLFGALLVYAASGAGGLISRAISLPAALLGIFLVLAPLSAWQKTKSLRLAEYLLKPLPERLGSKCLGGMRQTLDTLRLLRSLGVLLKAVVYTIFVMFFDYLTCFTLLYAFGWPVPFYTALAMHIALSLAGMLPAAPGYVGLYQAAAVLVLTQFGLPEAYGVTYATVLQVLTLLFFISIGGKRLFALQKENPDSPNLSPSERSDASSLSSRLP